MNSVVMKLNERPGPALVALAIVGFIVWWPVGLAILAYLIWSRTMGCCGFGFAHAQGRDGTPRSLSWMVRSSTSGNQAFDQYRTETLRRLEEEQREFQDFVRRLRTAKDKAEFDQFMAERRDRTPAGGPLPQPA
jgi:hypothetical protein